ncbi:MAG TPA: hypothetical protein VIR54_00185 [Vicinamibacterales bacterium]
MARLVLHRCAWADSRPSVRRRRVRAFRKDHSTIAGRRRWANRQRSHHTDRRPRHRGRGRLGQRAIAGKLPRVRANAELRFNCHSGPPRVYTAPRRLALNEWALAGEWTIGKQTVSLSGANGRIAYRFHARDLHLVMSPPRQANGVRFHVSLDGQPPGAARGLDVDDDGYGALVEPRLYQLIRQPMPIADRTLEIEFMASGVEAFAFTFG